jgi:hypothetical protein
VGSFSGNTTAAYAKVCAITAEGLESLDDLSHQLDAYDLFFHRRLANANCNDKVRGSRRRRPRTKRCLNSTESSPVLFVLSAGTLRFVRRSSSAFSTAVTQAEKTPETHTSRFVPGVLEMMKLQAPLRDTDKDPAMAAEALRTRTWLRPTHHTWFRCDLLFGRLARATTKNIFRIRENRIFTYYEIRASTINWP